MKKRYLETVEDVLALKDTDTKILEEVGERFNEGSYYKFINGIPCRFDSNKGEWQVNISIWSEDKPYILEEEPMQEATEEDVGKLCWFYDTYNRKVVGKLREVLQDNNFPFRSDYGTPSVHCCPLTKDEIKEFMEKAE